MLGKWIVNDRWETCQNIQNRRENWISRNKLRRWKSIRRNQNINEIENWPKNAHQIRKSENQYQFIWPILIYLLITISSTFQNYEVIFERHRHADIYNILILHNDYTTTATILPRFSSRTENLHGKPKLSHRIQNTYSTMSPESSSLEQIRKMVRIESSTIKSYWTNSISLNQNGQISSKCPKTIVTFEVIVETIRVLSFADIVESMKPLPTYSENVKMANYSVLIVTIELLITNGLQPEWKTIREDQTKTNRKTGAVPKYKKRYPNVMRRDWSFSLVLEKWFWSLH